jgi:hypothetical protein
MGQLCSVGLVMLKASLMAGHQAAPAWLIGVGWLQRAEAEMLA